MSRPRTDAARATAWASGERRLIRAMTASSIESGTPASRMALPLERASGLSAPSSSSMWSGSPSVRSNTASATSRGAGSPVSRMSVAMSAVSSRVSGWSRISSARRWVTRRARQSRRPAPGGTSSIRWTPTTRSRRSAACRASSPTISRLTSSAHWRSSNARRVGPSNDIAMRSAISRTIRRRRTCSAVIAEAHRSRSSQPASRERGERVIALARSRATAAGTSTSSGATDPATVSKPRAWAVCRIASRNRVLPIPASPASRSARPCPAETSARTRSSSSS